MKEARRVKLSKFLSFLLRHHPEEAGLRLEPGGWVEVEDLLAACSLKGWDIGRSDLEQLIKEGDKPRFSFSRDGTKIRANYGHSVSVDLDLEPLEPPANLFHGTARRYVGLIKESGLQSKSRQMVHLSPDRDTAKEVGGRHGAPVVLTIQAARMAEQGFDFYQPAPGTWLTLEVPPEFIEFP